MTTTVTWESWSAAEHRWKARHPIAARSKGWHQRMLAEISGQLGGARRPAPPVHDYDLERSECQHCEVELIQGSCDEAPFADVEMCPNCGRCHHRDWWHG